ncbi:MAG: hypothetical protein FRX48_01053 [Lasallia pustulata]|uniref:Thiaminase-2/PQQC domain-containing protein n=1 Tax=Lasallia pustulata TaxID=136370 RepID=A0A5M8Q572_9LECA|nr:MAG: hypothetical protein FRX48_01053 [Lasallia pustulata]
MRLTESLMDHDQEKYQAATQAPFLQAAGMGQVGKTPLSRWLSQDRLYAQGYVRFIGMMLSKFKLPSAAHTNRNSWYALDILISALTNIKRELLFFEDVAQRYGLDLETPWPGEDSFGPTPITRGYLDLFMNAASPAASLLEGMLLLWATEQCYYSAWLYALHSRSRQQQPIDEEAECTDADGGALRRDFIPNWTSDEFRDFVLQIGDLVDELAAEEEELDRPKRTSYMEVWKQVLWLEARFWPPLEES